MFCEYRLIQISKIEAETEKKNVQEKKRKSWDEKEEISYNKVLEREQTLFGELKGSIHRRRLDAWQEVADILNSYELFLSTERQT